MTAYEIRLNQKSLGLCQHGKCPNIPKKDHTLCEKHLQQLRDNAATVRHHRRDNGLCVQCGKESKYGQARCENCRLAKTSRPPRPVIKEQKEEEHLKQLQKKLTTYNLVVSKLNLLHDWRSQYVLLCRFGVEKQTLREVGEKLGITRQRVCQIQNEALETIGGIN